MSDYMIESILTRLRNGESLEMIGNDFASSLNSARSQYEEEVAAQKDELRKMELLENIANFMNEYFEILGEDIELDADDVEDMIAVGLDGAYMIEEIVDGVQKAAEEADKVFKDFFANMK